jgi:dolichyl-phosphate-mannose--protein O-mannosyl transferase
LPGLVNLLCLWFIIGDLNISIPTTFKHTIFRGFYVIIIPVIIYIFTFHICPQILTNEADDEVLHLTLLLMVQLLPNYNC